MRGFEEKDIEIPGDGPQLVNEQWPRNMICCHVDGFMHGGDEYFELLMIKNKNKIFMLVNGRRNCSNI